MESIDEKFSTRYIPVSIIVPAYNEAKVIVESIKSLAILDYERYEVIVINDGSTDNTVEEVLKNFNLVKTHRPITETIKVKEIRDVYEGTYNDVSITLIDKNNGGKADALNAGINASRYPLFVAMDADCILKRDAIDKLVKPFLMDRRTIAAGGNIRISNNLKIENGEIKEYNYPKGYFLIYQTFEYLRVFLIARTAWNIINANLIISGAFGMFKKSKVLEIGGYRTDTIGEDMELVMRLNIHCLDLKEDYRIDYVIDAYTFTQVPTTIKDFAKQRIRWHVGLMQCLSIHKKTLFNPKYKQVSFLGIAYYTLFELLSAVIEVTGYFLIILAIAFGLFNPWMFVFFSITILVYAFSVTVSALNVEKYILSVKTPFRIVIKFMLYSIAEPLIYRQVYNLIRIYAMIRYRKHKHSWNKVERKTY
jgi:cellulose synthase/poly-beta-1,6-N-acetylglucosamine synthase-like glycosyltransferase